MSDPLANAHHRSNAARWRAHPFARASDALEAKIVALKAQHLQEALKVQAVLSPSVNGYGYDVRTTTFLDAVSLRAVLGSPAGHIDLIAKASIELAKTIFEKLVEHAHDGRGPGVLNTRSPL